MPKTILFLLILSLNLVAYCQAPFNNVIDFILKKFEDHDVVAIGERHWGQLDSDLRMALIYHPEFPKIVDDILIEFGNSLYQDLLDRYVYGGPVSYEEVAIVWQNTTQIGTWDAEIYGTFFKSVREINLKLPQDQKVRILAGGQPIDWSKINSAKDLSLQTKSFPVDRGSYPVIIAEKEVLNKNRKAIAIFGHNQIDKSSGQVVGGINTIRPNSAYSIGTTRAYFGDDNYFERSYSQQKSPLIIELASHPARNFDADRFFGFKRRDEGSLYRMLDAVLFFGQLEDLRTEAPIRSAEYESELARRRMIRSESRRYQE